ncbi:hypothetical protein RvVAR0630_18290 [Agrobacterium vitis]|uniref:C1q-like domain-containing protein n=1 Tax=Rhizobium/Agrobacterium group TaxID=227290 RepID=UPI0015D681D6|nr:MULTISPECIES: hypothetical protein [Rhizobium/Agrobacterium group]MCF1471203.1 hypothetical protein [Allorhizobium ampelinum]BCH59205.1 hypothetical protein RvVAR0630_18290 [Agrobacterium vitis]
MAQPYPISRETREEAIFFGDGGSSYGPFGLKIFDSADVLIYTKATGATVWTEQAVTITKASDEPFDEFSIAFAGAIPNTTKIKVISARVHERTAGLTQGVQLNPDALEKELSKVGTILQELARDRDRSIKMDFDAGAGLTVSSGLDDGDTLMKSGNQLVKGANAADIANAQENAAIAAAAAVAAAASASSITDGLDKRVRFDAAQSLTDAQSAQARSNIGAALWVGARTVFDYMTSLQILDAAAMTGLQDHTVAVNAALAAGVTRFPAGRYNFSGDVTFPETSTGTIIGAGPGATLFVFSSGGLKLPCKGRPPAGYHSKALQGVTVATKGAATDTGVKIYRTDAGVIDTWLELTDVVIIGFDGIYGSGSTGPSQFWQTALDIQSCRFVKFKNVMLQGGGPGKSTYGLRIRANDTSDDAQFGFDAEGLRVNGFTKGASITGWIEGVYWTNFEIWGCRDAFEGSHTGTTVGTWKFQNGHMNASRNTFKTDNVCAIALGLMSVDRGFIEPGYNTAYQEVGVIGDATNGYHYAGQSITISNASADGQIQIDAITTFTAFADTTNHVELNNVTRFTVDNLICNGPAVTAALRLSGTTNKGAWSNLVVDKQGGSIGAAVNIDGTCSDIAEGSVVSNATTRIYDPSDVLGKYRTAFIAYASTTIPSVTGDGTFYTLLLNTTQINTGSGYNTATGKFVAQVTGPHQFNLCIKMTGVTSAHVDGSLLLVTPAGNRTFETNPYAQAAGGAMSLNLSCGVYLIAGEEVYPRITVNGGTTKVISMVGGFGATMFDGHLVRAF